MPRLWRRVDILLPDFLAYPARLQTPLQDLCSTPTYVTDPPSGQHDVNDNQTTHVNIEQSMFMAGAYRIDKPYLGLPCRYLIREWKCALPHR